ncbi:MAG: DNA/RNA nuclease SfsA, partial [Cyanobacteria bacterium P01_H01_bin.130]
RKLAYTWEAIQLEGAAGDLIWVGVNTSLPNRVMRTVLEKRLLPELGPYSYLKSEVKYGSQNSRIDFLLTGLDGEETGIEQADEPPIAPKRGSKFKDEPGIYIEVKNTTWSDRTLALFPDTVTTRGQKHLEELTEIVKTPSLTHPDINHRAVMIYFINREDCDRFAPGDERDPRYGELLRAARQAGAEILPCRFAVTPEGVRFLGLAPCSF